MTTSFKDRLTQTIGNEPPVPPARPRDPASLRILAHAKDLLLIHGYGRVSMDLIAVKAHVSKTALYSRFPSKKHVFAAVIQCEVRSFSPPFDPEEVQDLPTEEALTHIISRMFDTMLVAEKWRLEQILFLEISRHPDLRQVFAESALACEMAAFIRYFELVAARGVLDPQNVWFAAAFLGSLLKGYYFNFVTTGVLADLSAEERSTLARQASHTLVHGIGKPMGAVPHPHSHLDGPEPGAIS